MPTITYQDLNAFATAVYHAAGASPDDAATVARHQAQANLVGHDSHGVQLMASYVDRIDKSHIMPKQQPVVMRESPGAVFVNGGWGFGPVVSEFTMNKVIEKAKTLGVGVGVVREQSHVGRLADYPQMASSQGFIALMMCDSGQSPKIVAPFGGRTARLGTNPICIAFPSDLPGPVTIDMATSAVANGKIGLARARKQPIPAGWALDKEGRATTDPNAFFDGGAILPLGGPEGHKGYGLSFAVETLASILPGLGFGIDPFGRHNDGSFMVVIDPATFQPLQDFKDQVRDFVKFLKETPLADGFKEIFYPGELEYLTSVKRAQTGIEVEDATWNNMTKIAERFGAGGLLKAMN